SAPQLGRISPEPETTAPLMKARRERWEIMEKLREAASGLMVKPELAAVHQHPDHFLVERLRLVLLPEVLHHVRRLGRVRLPVQDREEQPLDVLLDRLLRRHHRLEQ